MQGEPQLRMLRPVSSTFFFQLRATGLFSDFKGQASAADSYGPRLVPMTNSFQDGNIATTKQQPAAQAR
jgi:hypothetical protein